MATAPKRTIITNEEDDAKVSVTDRGSKGVMAVEVIGSDDERYTMAIEYDSSNNPIYVGEAAEGTSKAASFWRIKKITYDSSNNPTDIQWASGNDEFNKVWDDRTTYTYS